MNLPRIFHSACLAYEMVKRLMKHCTDFFVTRFNCTIRGWFAWHSQAQTTGRKFYKTNL